MEFLLNLVLFIIPCSQAQELERFEKRIQGFESYQSHWEKVEDRRLAAAEQQKQDRQKHIESYEKARDSFRRPLPKITEEMDAEYAEREAQRELEALNKQVEFAQKQLRQRQLIEQKASQIEPQEYRLNEVVE